MSGYPVQYAKVQPPPLREETLARHRLLDWLAQKINHRVVLVLADAGYGKTTLLADFANRTRLRTLWYRMDEDDRDWISLLSHLVAAGREADASFAPRTAALLADTSLSGPTRDAAVDVFIRELPSIAPQGSVLIFDDFHLVDDAPDAQLIVRAIVANAPERLSVVFSSRRSPGIPMAKLRATGEVATLTTDDLRFDAEETGSLFRDTYHRSLEPEVLADVAARTEGWAASLQLVNAALRDRSPGEIRGFVRSLTGADQDLYDYLAEEVVGDLPVELQGFLMRTSILQVVTPDFAEVAAGIDSASAARLTANAERLTLLARRARGPRNELRYHPLVREFLESRLTREVGEPGVRSLHRLVATYAEARDWRIAAHHLWAAGDQTRAFELIDASATGIVGRGEYLVAAPFLAGLGRDSTRANFEVVLSRRDFKEGDTEAGLARAQRAVELDPTSQLAMANLASQYVNAGNLEGGAEWARRLLDYSPEDGIRGIATGILTIFRTSLDGDVRSAVAEFASLANEQHAAGYRHFEGISYLNLADAYRAFGDVAAARRSATTAVDLLSASSAGSEVSVARALLAWADAHEENLGQARVEVDAALASNDAGAPDVLSEATDLEAAYGDAVAADDYLSLLRASGGGAVASQIGSLETLVALRAGRVSEAFQLALRMDDQRPSSLIAHKARTLTLRAHSMVAFGADGARDAIDLAHLQATRQSAGLWIEYCAALRAVISSPEDLARYVRSRERLGAWPLSRIAEQIAERLPELGEAEFAIIEAEAKHRPERWRSALRLVIDAGSTDDVRAATLLEATGELGDVFRLRTVAHRYRGRPESRLGRTLARRLSPPAYVEDLGRVSITVGDRKVDGSAIRRKVLAMLCFLITRRHFSATRDEVMDALWPDFDPGDALNSLNQTVYFLRRVFEPSYKDDLSPGYVHHESDVLWLDSELVRSTSQTCIELIHGLGAAASPTEVSRLADLYAAPFALDFSYEEWATDHRTSLHSAYLQVVEQAVADDTAGGHFERGINVARRALELSPDADQLELSLLRLYRLTGSHAAAAEQYAHYAASMRETFGVEPPTLESL